MLANTNTPQNNYRRKNITAQLIFNSKLPCFKVRNARKKDDSIHFQESIIEFSHPNLLKWIFIEQVDVRLQHKKNSTFWVQFKIYYRFARIKSHLSNPNEPPIHPLRKKINQTSLWYTVSKQNEWTVPCIILNLYRFVLCNENLICSLRSWKNE